MNRKQLLTGLGAVFGVALVVGAVYVGVNLMTSGTLGLGSLQLPGSNASPEKGSYEIIPAPELPQTQPDLVGAVVEVTDNGFSVRADSPDGSGPLSEVVITGSTKVYQDATARNAQMGTLPRTADGNIQQIIESYEARAIQANNILTVWGERRGDRLIASVVLVLVK